MRRQEIEVKGTPEGDLAPFFDHELQLLDGCAADEGLPPRLLRSLVAEQVTTRADGRAGLRGAIERLIDGAAMDLVAADEVSRAD